MAGEALYYGTGRRKNAVARVRLVPGTGKVTINGREGAEYFGREALLDYAKTPFKVTDTMDHFDVIARINGGGISGQAGVTASPALCSTPATIAPSSRRPATSPATLVWSSVRSTA